MPPYLSHARRKHCQEPFRPPLIRWCRNSCGSVPGHLEGGILPGRVQGIHTFPWHSRAFPGHCQGSRTVRQGIGTLLQG
eukprot:11201117-Lingulodinium_polyedra.AAC.1